MMRSLAEKLEFKKELEERVSSFAVAVFKSLDALPQKVSSKVIAFQLGKSASSVGANYHEANRAESSDDFIHKIGVTLKECSESLYWLGLLQRIYPQTVEFQSLQVECDELVRIFQSIKRKMHEKRKVFTP